MSWLEESVAALGHGLRRGVGEREGGREDDIQIPGAVWLSRWAGPRPGRLHWHGEGWGWGFIWGPRGAIEGLAAEGGLGCIHEHQKVSGRDHMNETERQAGPSGTMCASFRAGSRCQTRASRAGPYPAPQGSSPGGYRRDGLARLHWEARSPKSKCL